MQQLTPAADIFQEVADAYQPLCIKHGDLLAVAAHHLTTGEVDMAHQIVDTGASIYAKEENVEAKAAFLETFRLLCFQEHTHGLVSDSQYNEWLQGMRDTRDFLIEAGKLLSKGRETDESTKTN